MLYSRRHFIQSSAVTAVGFTGLQNLISGKVKNRKISGYGPLIKDPSQILDLPKHFSIKEIFMVLEVMNLIQ